jgi:hypothetical protein
MITAAAVILNRVSCLKKWAQIKFPISDHVMPAQAGTQFFCNPL